MRSFRLPVAILSLLVADGCGGSADDTSGGEGAFSSNQATLLDFEFDAELTTDSSWNDKQTIEDQLLYTIGHLNGDRAVGRLDNVELTNVTKTDDAGKTRINYHAKLPVAWGAKTNLPTSYAFSLPIDVSTTGQQAFTDKHKASCVDFAAHDVDSGSMWYYYRPRKQGCDITDAEVVKTTATVTRSPMNTSGKYPEYQKVWEDDRFEIVAIFGKYEASATQNDAGIDGFNQFITTMKQDFAALDPQVSGDPTRDVTITATLADGKVVQVTALLVDAITQVWAGFQQRYESLTPTADIVAYNGHAGLGQNVRALAKMGKWRSGQYQIFFMNGCDTFAYVDGSLAQTRAPLNPDDPGGTKYMDFVTNAMPSFFSSMPYASQALIQGLLAYAQPKTYDEIFAKVDESEVVLVTGEEDNVFQPGMAIGSHH
jgi:hypothetical protein